MVEYSTKTLLNDYIINKSRIAVTDPDLEIREAGRSSKKIFRPFGPQFGPKLREAGPPRPLPWICHWMVK